MFVLAETACSKFLSLIYLNGVKHATLLKSLKDSDVHLVTHIISKIFSVCRHQREVLTGHSLLASYLELFTLPERVVLSVS
jgi:hypothetical protein